MANEIISKSLGYTHYDLAVWEDDNGSEYAIALSSEEALEAAKAYIRDSIWAFNASFLVGYVNMANNLSSDGLGALTEMITSYQQSKYEDANDDLYEFVKENFDELVEDAIAADGIGHFLSPYDSEEVESYYLSEDLNRAIKAEYELQDDEVASILAYRIN